MANETISQITIANTTYDICDADARTNSGFGCAWKIGFQSCWDSSHAISVAANQLTNLGSFYDYPGTDGNNSCLYALGPNTLSGDNHWAHLYRYPLFFQLMIHSKSTTSSRTLYVEVGGDSPIVQHFHINNGTGDTVQSMYGFLPPWESDGDDYPVNATVKIKSSAPLTNVYGNFSLLVYKTNLKYNISTTSFLNDEGYKVEPVE